MKEKEHNTWVLSPRDWDAGGAGRWQPGVFLQGIGVLGVQEYSSWVAASRDRGCWGFRNGACPCRTAATERGSRPGNKLSESLEVSGTPRAALVIVW